MRIGLKVAEVTTSRGHSRSSQVGGHPPTSPLTSSCVVMTPSCRYTDTCLSAFLPGSSSSSSKRPHDTILGNEDSTTPPTTSTQKRRRAEKTPASISHEKTHGKAVEIIKIPGNETLTGTTRSDAYPPQIDMEQIPLDDDDNSLIDPVLLAEGAILAGVIAGATAHTLPEAAEEEVFNRITNRDRPTAPSIGSVQQVTSLKPLDYTRYLSSINVVSSHAFANKAKKLHASALEAYAGNSRDPPSLFVLRCKNHVLGCDYSTTKKETLKLHDIRCKITQPKPIKPFPCSECGRRYSSKRSFDRHYQDSHTPWIPKTCHEPRETCDPNHIYQTRSEYKIHHSKFHVRSASEYEPARCPIPECGDDRILKTRLALDFHLLRAHKLAADEAKQWKRSFVPASYVPQKCPVGGCTSTRLYSTRQLLKEHLKTKKHNLSPDDVSAYLDTT